MVSFCVLIGGAFALVFANIHSILNEPLGLNPPPRHPEAPAPGEEVMYVDLSREKLEDLYKDK